MGIPGTAHSQKCAMWQTSVTATTVHHEQEEIEIQCERTRTGS